MIDSTTMGSPGDLPQDIGAPVFLMASTEALDHLVKILGEEGYRPEATFHTPEVRRFIYKAFVLNNDGGNVGNNDGNGSESWVQLKRPTAGLTLIFRNHQEVAERMAEKIRTAGFDAEIIDSKTVGVDGDDLTFLAMGKDYLLCGLLILRVPAHEMSGPAPVPYEE